MDPRGADRKKKPQPCGLSSHPEITSFDRQLIGVIAGFLKNNYSQKPTMHLQQARTARAGHMSAHSQGSLRRASSGSAPSSPPKKAGSASLFPLLHPQWALSRDLSHSGETFVQPASQPCYRCVTEGHQVRQGHPQGSTGGTNRACHSRQLGFPFSGCCFSCLKE